MTGTYRNSRRDQQVADDYLGDFMPCSFCGVSTERATLVEYGSRCGGCYQQYLTGGRALPSMPSREQRVAAVQRMKAALGQMGRPGRQWAFNLRDREQSGEVLSFAQRDAWRAALKAHDVLDDARGGADVSRDEVDDALLATGDLPSMSDRERYASDPRFGAWVAGAPA